MTPQCIYINYFLHYNATVLATLPLKYTHSALAAINTYRSKAYPESLSSDLVPLLLFVFLWRLSLYPTLMLTLAYQWWLAGANDHGVVFLFWLLIDVLWAAAVAQNKQENQLSEANVRKHAAVVNDVACSEKTFEATSKNITYHDSTSHNSWKATGTKIWC